MVTILLLVIASYCAYVSGNLPPSIVSLRDDFFIKPSQGSKNRLAGWTVLAPKNVKCDMVRRHIKKFGYCWNDENEKRGINTTVERGWVREVVQQWEKCGGIKIVEEPKCRTGPDFVTIYVGNYGPVVYPQIDIPTCRIDGFTMNLDFYTFGVNIDGYRTTEKIRKSNIQMYALHEFGHFLGFDHEQNRKDRTECYYQVDASETGPDAIYSNYAISKEYDIDSIMNYCRPNVHYKPWLSVLDKKAVADAYGGGNKAECDAATKPWQWGPNDGLYESTYQELLKEYNGGSSVNSNTQAPPVKPSGNCADVATAQECQNLIRSCKDEGMKYWCPKTCKYC